jgi:hypothetical protein
VPTFTTVDRFDRDYARLSQAEREAFREARKQFVDDLRGKQGFRRGLRVKGVQAAPGVYEMTWAGDGCATWQYGPTQIPGEAHIVWRRIGTHDIFRQP